MTAQANRFSEHRTATTGARMPVLYISHGAGPCFFMDWAPPHAWNTLGNWLRNMTHLLPEAPRALLIVSAHWEEPEPTVMTGERPGMLYDYYGFPAHTYTLQWPAPGAPQLAARVRSLLAASGINSRQNRERGFDHGSFIPMMLGFPQTDIPATQLSLKDDLDVDEHIAIGQALQPLRDEGVLIIGSGFSFHNLRAFASPGVEVHEASLAFDDWLTHAVEAPDAETRQQHLRRWEAAPFARFCHPRSEHLLPLMVASGAAGPDPGHAVLHDALYGNLHYSCFLFRP